MHWYSSAAGVAGVPLYPGQVAIPIPEPPFHVTIPTQSRVHVASITGERRCFMRHCALLLVLPRLPPLLTLSSFPRRARLSPLAAVGAAGPAAPSNCCPDPFFPVQQAVGPACHLTEQAPASVQRLLSRPRGPLQPGPSAISAW
jgi:hypothetical protein